MKERPILFAGAMVRALLSGAKTQTRRVLRVQPPAATGQVSTWHHPGPSPMFFAWVGLADGGAEISGAWSPVPCPYGQPGDRLWVRETWAEVPRVTPETDEDFPWRKDGKIVVYSADPHWDGARQFLCADGVLRWAKPARWRPSIHMPRWASRITLEVTGVRVEKLQDISEADALAEGIVPVHGGFGLPAGEHFHCHDPRESYWSLWESINGPGSVESNPWLWVVEFPRAAR